MAAATYSGDASRGKEEGLSLVEGTDDIESNFYSSETYDSVFGVSPARFVQENSEYDLEIVDEEQEESEDWSSENLDSLI